ncbi:general transcription repressor [Tulasnella sp. 419]|nr:general transcription repressor [Tulasnella sp. 419]
MSQQSTIYNHRPLQPSGPVAPPTPATAARDQQPPPSAASARLQELLDVVRHEFDGIVHECGSLRTQRDEYESRIGGQVTELNIIRQALYELETQHAKIRHQYEAEITQLRHELAAAQQQQPIPPPPPPSSSDRIHSAHSIHGPPYQSGGPPPPPQQQQPPPQAASDPYAYKRRPDPDAMQIDHPESDRAAIREKDRDARDREAARDRDNYHRDKAQKSRKAAPPPPPSTIPQTEREPTITVWSRMHPRFLFCGCPGYFSRHTAPNLRLMIYASNTASIYFANLPGLLYTFPQSIHFHLLDPNHHTINLRPRSITRFPPSRMEARHPLIPLHHTNLIENARGGIVGTSVTGTEML